MFFLDFYRRLLQAEQIDVSYFAAGIVAHLASDGAQNWLIAGTDRADILQELVGEQNSQVILIELSLTDESWGWILFLGCLSICILILYCFSTSSDWISTKLYRNFYTNRRCTYLLFVPFGLFKTELWPLIIYKINQNKYIESICTQRTQKYVYKWIVHHIFSIMLY